MVWGTFLGPSPVRRTFFAWGEGGAYQNKAYKHIYQAVFANGYIVLPLEQSQYKTFTCRGGSISLALKNQYQYTKGKCRRQQFQKKKSISKSQDDRSQKHFLVHFLYGIYN